MVRLRALVPCAFALFACGGSDYHADVATEMRQALSYDLHTLVTATRAICDAAPSGRGWDARVDAASIQSMKSAWIRARSAYEHVEGAVAPMFPELDFAIDARYEEYLVRAPDAYAFDDRGVVGLDAIERIVWSDATPPMTVDYERTIPGYVPAAFPATANESADFKNVLCAKLVSDASALEAGWSSHPMDVGAAYGGLVSLVDEQRAELVLWQTSQQESRYSQTTMNDLRANIEGVESIYGIFRNWVASKDGGADIDAKIEANITAIESSYESVPGNMPPDAASADYENLLDIVASSTDPTRDGTLPFEMKRARALMGF